MLTQHLNTVYTVSCVRVHGFKVTRTDVTVLFKRAIRQLCLLIVVWNTAMKGGVRQIDLV